MKRQKIHFQIKRVRQRIRNTDETFNTSSELENIISKGPSISRHGREKTSRKKI